MRFTAVALVTLLVVACSRDTPRLAADSLPDAGVGQATDSMNHAAQPDTSLLPGTSDGLTGSRITVERAVVNGILWGASGEDVRKSLGAPRTTNTVWEEALGDSSTVLEYPGMGVRLVERRVVGIHCTVETCITGDAVRVGATRAEVEQVYGKGREERSGPDSQLAYPFTTDDSCALRFVLQQGRVRAIDVSCQLN